MNSVANFEAYGMMPTDYGGIYLVEDIDGEYSGVRWECGIVTSTDLYVLIVARSLNRSYVGVRVRYTADHPGQADTALWDAIAEVPFNPTEPPWLEMPQGGRNKVEPPLDRLEIPEGPKRLRASRRIDLQATSRALQEVQPRVEDPSALPEQIMIEIWDDPIVSSDRNNIKYEVPAG